MEVLRTCLAVKMKNFQAKWHEEGHFLNLLNRDLTVSQAGLELLGLSHSFFSLLSSWDYGPVPPPLARGDFMRSRPPLGSSVVWDLARGW